MTSIIVYDGCVKKILYLMLGYPGSGKTTVSKIIHELTGAVHLWADRVRRERFGNPRHDHQENIELYDHLNEVTAELLRAGNSVVFDTNFNFYKDREKLGKIADEHGAETKLIWVKTPKDIAKERATANARQQHTRILGDMPPERWDKIVRNLQPPRENEDTIEVDGTKVTKEYIRPLLEK